MALPTELGEKRAKIQTPFFHSSIFDKVEKSINLHLRIRQNHGVDLGGFDAIAVVAEKSG